MKSFLRFLMKMQEFSNYYFFIILLLLLFFFFQSPAKNSREKKKYDAKIENEKDFLKIHMDLETASQQSVIVT